MVSRPRGTVSNHHAPDPATIGIQDINRSEWDEPVEIRPAEVPAFRNRGITT